MHNIEKITKNNQERCHIVYTASHSQLVLHSLPSNDSLEFTPDHNSDQIIMVIDGTCDGIVNGAPQILHSKDVLYIPAGSKFSIINNGKKNAKLFSLTAPSRIDYEDIDNEVLN